MTEREIIATSDNEGQRLDIYLAQTLSEHFSRSQIKKWIEQGGVKVGGREVAAHYKVKAGDSIRVEMVEAQDDGLRGEDIPLDIVYEDEELLLINKPAGMVVHPAHGNQSHTLVNALLFHVKKLSGAGGGDRPGIVHRLDQGTSGIMVVAKNDRAHAFLAQQFKDHTIERIYRVVVKGRVEHQEGICEEAIGRAFLNRKKVIVKPSGGRDAVTYFRVLERYARATLLEIRLETGRTHQIRVHMRHMDHPVLGDALYGVTSPYIDRQAVHAFSLRLTHPKTGELLYRECPMPADMQKLVERLAAE